MQAVETNKYSAELDEAYKNIVIIADRDEASAVANFQQDIQQTLNAHTEKLPDKIQHNTWTSYIIHNLAGKEIEFNVLLLLIPFEDNGALETFLLEAVSNKNTYDKSIIDDANRFVDTIDPEHRYLNKRRYLTKAKFDVYFSIRTPVTQFAERQNIIMGVPWEEYETIQESFSELKKLG